MVPPFAAEVLRIESFGNLCHPMHSDIGWQERVDLLYKAISLVDRQIQLHRTTLRCCMNSAICVGDKAREMMVG